MIHFADKDHFCIPREKRFDEEAIKAFCTQEGLAFYDTACEVRRLKDNASDAFLEVVTPTDIPALLRQIPACDTLVTTGQKATEVVSERFGCGVPPVGGCVDIVIDGRNLRFWRMPSSSRAYPGEKGYTTLERTGIRPCLDVCGIWGGYTGEGAKTVLPSTAHAKISMRLVPNQTSEKITELFENHFRAIASFRLSAGST